MPIKKSYKKRKPMTKKKETFRQAKPHGIKPEPFPMRLYTRAKYIDSFAVSSGALGTATSYPYRLTSIWDPRHGLGGNTVAGHAQLMALYNKYLVMGAKITVSFTDPTSDGLIVFASLFNKDIPLSGKTYEQLSNYPNTYCSALNNSGKQRKTFDFYVKPWSALGISKVEYMTNSDQYASEINANPLKETYLRAGCVGNNVGVGTITVTMHIRIIYYIKLYDRKILEPTTTI